MAVSIVGEAAVRLRPNAEGFSEEAQVGIVGPLGEVAKKAAGLFAAAFAAEKVGDFLKESVTQASDLNESASKAGVVFGDAVGQVQKFASTAATSLGLSQQQALESTGTFGNLFKSMGLGGQQTADMSTGLVKLAGDLASFNNLDPTDVLDKLRSGLTGETEPLKDLGVNINQAMLKQQALKMGLDASGPTLSAAVSAQAAYALILQQTTTAQGDFTRTSSGLANQQRIMAAQFTDLKANVGGLLYPFVQLGAQGITKGLMPALLALSRPLAAAGGQVSTFLNDAQAAVHAAYSGVDADTTTMGGRVGSTLGNLANEAQGYWSTFADAAKGGAAGALGTEDSFAGFLVRLGVGFHGVADNAAAGFMSIRTHAAEALAPLGKQLAPAFDSIKAEVGQMFSGIFSGAGGGGFFSAINGMIGKAEPLITGLIDKIAPVIQTLIPTITNVIVGILPVVQSVFSQLVPVIGQILPVIMEITGIWRQVFMAAFQALLPVIPPLVTTLGQLITQLVSGLAPILSALAPIVAQLITTGMNQFKAVLAALVPILPVLVNALAQVAQVVAGALLQVLQAIMPVLPVVAQAFGAIAAALAGALTQALTAIAPLLPTLINAFMMLINAVLQPLLPLLPLVASLIGPLANIITILVQALAPILPVLIQVVVMLVQLAVAALVPLMPIIQLVVNLVSLLLQALMPVINVLLQVASVILGAFGSALQFGIGIISGIIGWFQNLFSSITSIGGKITGFLGHIWDGIASGAKAAFDGAVGAVKTAINWVIGIINDGIGFINRDVIDIVNKVPFINIPHIPLIPTLHEGGVYTNDAGEGLALLRDQELVVTPEQRRTADDLLRSLLNGNLATSTTTTTQTAHTQVNQYITQLPGESGAALAARVSDQVVFNLNNGVTAHVGSGGLP